MLCFIILRLLLLLKYSNSNLKQLYNEILCVINKPKLLKFMLMFFYGSTPNQFFVNKPCPRKTDLLDDIRLYVYAVSHNFRCLVKKGVKSVIESGFFASQWKVNLFTTMIGILLLQPSFLFY